MDTKSINDNLMDFIWIELGKNIGTTKKLLNFAQL